MKRKLLSILVIFTLLLSFTVTSNASTVKDIPIYIDGVKVVMDHQPIASGGKTYVPADTFEKMGAKLEWSNELGRIVYTKGLLYVVIFRGSIAVNGNQTEIESALMTDNNEPYVPVRIVAEIFGAKVEWKDGSVYITSNTTGYKEYPKVPDYGKMFNCQERNCQIAGTENVNGIVKSGTSTFTHSYSDSFSKESALTKYKEELANCGYALSNTSERNNVKLEIFTHSDGSNVAIVKEKNGLCMVGITVPVRLENLYLKATN